MFSILTKQRENNSTQVSKSQKVDEFLIQISLFMNDSGRKNRKKMFRDFIQNFLSR